MTGPLLDLDDLADLRAYERERDAFRAEVIALKRDRRIQLGPLVSAVLENRTTVRFQVQEMLRVEKILDDDLVRQELDVYNPLIPAPGELSMTLFVELTTPEQMREWLPKLIGVERSVVLRLGEPPATEEVRDEVDPEHAAQLTREDVTASVHYVKIRLSPEQRHLFATSRAALAIDHPAYAHEVLLGEATKASVLADWGPPAS